MSITYDEAVALLPEGDDIHTIRAGGTMILGCDWRRDAILAAIKESPVIQLAGPCARALGHGLCIYDHLSPDRQTGRPLFIATDEAMLNAFDPQKTAV